MTHTTTNNAVLAANNAVLAALADLSRASQISGLFSNQEQQASP